MARLSFRPLSLADAPPALVILRQAEGGLGRLPEEMDRLWMEETLASALKGGVAIGAWDGSRLVGTIKASRMPSVQFQHVLLGFDDRGRPRIPGSRHRTSPV